jgi:predicted nuclease of predicted toxin-antitoxin system
VKLLLDEMLDHRLANHFAAYGHGCTAVKDAGLKGLANGALLTAAELRGFEVMLTVDKNIQHQSNLADRKIAVIVVRVFRNRLSSVLAHVPEVLRVLESIRPGELRYVGEPKLLAKHGG